MNRKCIKSKFMFESFAAKLISQNQEYKFGFKTEVKY
jgi:hypothetical protein